MRHLVGRAYQHKETALLWLSDRAVGLSDWLALRAGAAKRKASRWLGLG